MTERATTLLILLQYQSSLGHAFRRLPELHAPDVARLIEDDESG